MASTVLRLASVLARTGLSRSTLYRIMAAGAFPRSVRLGERAIGWRETDVEKWLASLEYDRGAAQGLSPVRSPLTPTAGTRRAGTRRAVRR